MKVAIVGGGALGREVHDWLLAVREAGAAIDVAGYADDAPPSEAGPRRPDLPYLGPIDGLAAYPELELAMAIASPAAKQAVGDRLRGRGGRFRTVVHPTAVVAHTARLGEGSTVGPQVYIASHARIADLVLVNSLTGIGHDTLVGACCTISSQVDVTGGVRLGARVFIGSGARILPELDVGEDARIGAGAVVVRRVRPGQTMFAAPARLLRG